MRSPSVFENLLLMEVDILGAWLRGRHRLDLRHVEVQLGVILILLDHEALLLRAICSSGPLVELALHL